MPIYDYVCQGCGLKFERSIPFRHSSTNVRCPSGHRDVKRIYSAAAVIFRGQGFYLTDSRAGEVSPEKKDKP